MDILRFKIYYPSLIKRSSVLKLRFWYLPKPNRHAHQFNWQGSFNKDLYDEVVSDWKKSVLEEDIHPTQIQIFKSLAADCHNVNTQDIFTFFDMHLQAGISIPPDNIEIRTEYGYHGNEGHSAAYNKNYAFINKITKLNSTFPNPQIKLFSKNQEIFKRYYHTRSGKECDDTILSHMDYCIKAMDESNKKVAIELLKWKGNRFIKLPSGMWYDTTKSFTDDNRFTEEQLFDKYIEELNNKK